MDRALEGNTIIVTGGGSGIGRAAAIACAAAGARVVVADIGVAQGKDAASAIRQQDGEAFSSQRMWPTKRKSKRSWRQR